MTRAADALELLLPGAPAAELERARRGITFARLLASDARKAEAHADRSSLPAARAELEQWSRRRSLAAVLELLRHHLYSALGPDSFVWLGETEGRVHAAWSALEAERGERPWLALTPEPDESALSVAARLIESALKLGLAPEAVELWRARWTRASAGPERGEAAFRELAASASARGAAAQVVAGAWCGWIECCLDRGALRHARAALDDARERVAGDPRLRRLAAWVALLQEDEGALRAAESGIAEWRGRLPVGLAELRQRRAAWLPHLTGRGPVPVAESQAARTRTGRAATRREFGAALLAVFALRPGGGHQLVHAEVAPGFRTRLADWLRDREGACANPDEPEHRLVIGAVPVLLHRQASFALRGTIDATSVRSLALAPALDERGEVAGWLRIECEHHLLPSCARLMAAADSWRARIAAVRADGSVRTGGASGGRGGELATASVRVDDALPLARSDSPCAEVLRTLVDELAIKTAQRRWWGFCVEGQHAELVAEGGAGIAERGSPPGGRRALSRALLTAGVVRFDEPSVDLSLLSASGSGVVLPLVARGRLCGLLAIESGRRKDFSDALVARLGEGAQACAVELRIAQFREWHAERFGHDLCFAAASRGRDAWLDEMFAAGRSRAAVALVGPAGAGKTTLARWLHFESGRASEPLIVLACGAEGGEVWGDARNGGGLSARAGNGTVVLRDIERLGEASQVRVLEAIRLASGARASSAGEPGGPRWIATSTVPLAEARSRCGLRRDLAETLERLELHVPPLAQRRREIPSLALAIARRFARSERLTPPSFADDALACLWRQPWEGNLRALENLVFKVVLLHPGQCVAAPELERVAARFGFALQRRLPSRQPDRELVLAALDTTRNQRGTWNKTRAAAYLGWDPDTLVHRMNECGLLEGGQAPEREAPAPPGD